MLDERGRPTKEYPHVHVIHDPNKNEIRLHNTLRKGVHVEKSKLPGGASGNQVNAAVADLLDGLPRWFQ